MNESTDLERQMREALGISQLRKNPAREASNPVRGYLVVLSVRGESGPAFRFEHRSRSISKTEAILEAEKAAKKEGYRPWALVDAEQI